MTWPRLPNLANVTEAFARVCARKSVPAGTVPHSTPRPRRTARASWGSINTTGAWLCEDLWNHYAFTRDAAYLRAVYPTMKGAAEFFLSTSKGLGRTVATQSFAGEDEDEGTTEG